MADLFAKSMTRKTLGLRVGFHLSWLLGGPDEPGKKFSSTTKKGPELSYPVASMTLIVFTGR